jgi:predicted DNA-binding protein
MKTKLLIEMPKELKEQLKKLAIKNEMKMGTYIRQLILKEVKKLSTD